jgi:hypothetical protein
VQNINLDKKGLGLLSLDVVSKKGVEGCDAPQRDINSMVPVSLEVVL